VWLATRDIDHIVALAEGGSNDLSNFAPAHTQCNLRKGVKPLLVARNEHRVEKNFNEDFAGLLPPHDPAEVIIDEGHGIVRFNGQTLPLYRCSNTDALYFYHLIPTKHIEKDADVQPRPLDKQKIIALGRHLQTNFQLTSAVCRLVGGRLLLFDGQHKAAAQILWNGAEAIDCKVVVAERAMVDRVIEHAHGPLRQMQFKSSELGKKLRAQYRQHIDNWRAGHPGEEPSERAILKDQLGHTQPQMRNDIARYIAESVKERTDLGVYISAKRRSECPMTDKMFEELLKRFVRVDPLEVPMESDQDFRQEELDNLLFLLGRIRQESLEHWPADGRARTAEQELSKNLWREAPKETWQYLLEESLHLLLRKASDEAVCYDNHIWTEEEKRMVAKAVQAVFHHNAWKNPVAKELFATKRPAELRDKLADLGLTYRAVYDEALR
jgi:hypothetical protein